jgi:DNA-binding CsgD family transcriptional regulator
MGRLYDPADLLTPRQLEIMRLTYAGKIDEELCAALGITLRTLRWHATQIRQVFPLFRLGVALSRLTERERTLAWLVAEGLSNQEIAIHLGIARQSVANAVVLLYQKTGSENRVQLALNTLIVQNRIAIGATEAVKA